MWLGAVAAVQPARADTPDAGVASPAELAAPISPESPRASLSRYLDLCREGRYADAAAYLDLSGAPAGAGPSLARKLKAVLDRHIWFEMDRISRLPMGNGQDGLSPGLEELGQIPTGRGRAARESVYLVRREVEGGHRWLFSRATVGRIDAWYEALEGQWLMEHLPEFLLRPGPRELLWWQWIALPLLCVAAWLIGRLLAGLSRLALQRVAKRTASQWDDHLVESLRGPVAAGWALALIYFVLPSLALYEPGRDFVHRLLKSGAFLVFFWALFRLIDTGGRAITGSPWAKQHPASRSLVPLGSRVAKVALTAIAVVAIISEFGYPVASLVAGLGIGGLAVALAGQKTVENLFGAFSIGVDQPFREGDFVKVEDVLGTVEYLGLRSTRIRTLDRTLVTLPNGKLSETRVESFAARDRFRLSCILGLEYGTRAEQVRAVLAGVEDALRAEPSLWPEGVTVRLKELGQWSLDIEVMAWFATADWAAFQLVRQELLLAFMEVVERAGTSFAFPTRTVRMVEVTPGAAPKTEGHR
jgi:MscS family membrane protein